MTSAARQDREARRFDHAQLRLRARYGLELELADYRHLCELFRERRVTGERINHRGDIEAWVRFHGTWLCAIYNPGDGLIVTFLPAPPPLVVEEQLAQALKEERERMERRIVEAAHRHADSIVRSRLASLETALQHPGREDFLAKLKASDVAWFKRTMLRAAELIRSGAVPMAVRLLEAAAAFPKTFHPGQHQVEAEERLRSHMQALHPSGEAGGRER
jgi:DNA-binding transcriptional MerR regulator